MVNINKISETYEKLKKYSGNNPYILSLKKDVYVLKNNNAIGDFQVEYINRNFNFEPKQINKIVMIADWLGEKKQESWNLDFTPTKLKIISLIGETNTMYHCYVQYRQSVNPTLTFLPKNGVLTDFLCEDYNNLQLDFSWFDKKLKEINEDYAVMEHQKQGVKFVLSRKKCILSMDMGMGKTLTSIIASLMYGQKKVLVICPASIKTNWKNEIKRFVDEDKISIIKGFNEMNKSELIDFLKLPSDTKLKVDELREMAKENGKWNEGKQFTILNFDIIDEFHTNSRKKDVDSDLINSDFDIVIIDEAHKLSNNTSNRYKIIRNYLKKAKNEYTWLLTGTMVTNNVKNLYNMLSLIENNITGDYDYFMKRYCDAKKILRKGEWERCWNIWNKGRYKSYQMMDNSTKALFRDFTDRVGKHVTLSNGSTNLEELNERIKHIYFRVVKEDMMDIKKNIVPVKYTLTEEQKKEYDELWDKYEEEKRLEGIEVGDIKQLIEIAVNRQYISKVMIPNTIKLTDKLLSHDKKVFIVCCFDDEVYSLKEHYGDKAVIFNGKMNQKQKDKAVDEFNNNDNVKIFIGQIVACGVGINLNKNCNHAIFQNLSFTDAEFSQACDRIFRIGSKEDVYIYLQYFVDSVSERTVNIIKNKKEISEKIINDK